MANFWASIDTTIIDNNLKELDSISDPYFFITYTTYSGNIMNKMPDTFELDKYSRVLVEQNNGHGLQIVGNGKGTVFRLIRDYLKQITQTQKSDFGSYDGDIIIAKSIAKYNELKQTVLR